MNSFVAGCQICPRRCSAARTFDDSGYCGAAEPPGCFRVARLMVHHWEEPCISGTRGSGAVFFGGCSLGCRFCQNASISRGRVGSILDTDQLIAEMIKLHRLKVHNFNLVTPGHYVDRLPILIEKLRLQPDFHREPLPIVWNSSAYETVESIAGLSDSVDIWLPDLKFADSGLSFDLADTADYFAVASQSIIAMQRQQPRQVFSDDGMLQRGMIIRHLVLPGHWRDSCRILDFVAANLPLDTALSLMCQYTPQPDTGLQEQHPELSRRLTTYEYHKVVDHALKLGFSNLTGQGRSSADSAYTPDFSSLWPDPAGDL